MTDHDHEHDEEMEPPTPRRLHGRLSDGTHTELMDDCVGSQIVERTFIAQGEDGSILFLPLDGYRMIWLDPEP